ncbi:hypothetical protein CYMTET_38785 [Cymbomonas tetramitiformis]|uniref:ABC transporter n=2 Tax=Cymbomonas tetramitiformis TaxID=36881 RepID=A0AAE0CDE3_9CHLO|nr:hypothetical protein CYMTET_38785 [Cymbomonas tetramitiformis]
MGGAERVSIAGVHFVSGFILVITSFVMGGIEDTAAWNEMLVHYYRLLPPFCLGESLIQLSAQQLKALVGVTVESSFSWDVLGERPASSLSSTRRAGLLGSCPIRGRHGLPPVDGGRNLTYMSCEAAAFFILTLLLEHALHGTLLEQVASAAASRLGSMRSLFGDYVSLERDSHGEEVEDVDVDEERRRVEQLDPLSTSQAVTIRRLRKVYGAAGSTSARKVAVHNLSYAIGKREHFGLLGHNGAGKTTTLAMLTGDTVPTSGDALVCQHSVRKQLREVQRNIGYCPQVDPLLGLLTGHEQLAMFARLKGVPAAQVQSEVTATLKRARRAMWDTIQATTEGLAIILTTHSMEECEALCTRVGIMANGRLSCIGSPQHLRQRFGTGYRLEVRMSKREEQAALSELVRSTFAGAQSQEDHMGRMVFSLPLTDLSLSKAFRVLEDARSRHAFEDYSLSQPTLEQVFVSLTNKDHDSVQGGE